MCKTGAHAPLQPARHLHRPPHRRARSQRNRPNQRRHRRPAAARGRALLDPDCALRTRIDLRLRAGWRLRRRLRERDSRSVLARTPPARLLPYARASRSGHRRRTELRCRGRLPASAVAMGDAGPGSCTTLASAGPAAADRWVGACVPAGALAELGAPCRNANGDLDGESCGTGVCADLGALGVCSAACDGNQPLPRQCDLRHAGAWAQWCLTDCATAGACLRDPLLACAAPNSSAAGGGFQADAAAGLSFWRTKACASDAACGPSGTLCPDRRLHSQIAAPACPTTTGGDSSSASSISGFDFDVLAGVILDLVILNRLGGALGAARRGAVASSRLA